MGPHVPPGQSPPFEVVDEYHHGAWIIITAALGLVISLVCFLIRLYVRLMLIPPFARDDFVLLGATVMAIIQSILIFYACSCGFGTSITLLNESRLNQIAALVATSDIFALIILYLSKCCVIAIYLRLTPQKPHNRASWATLALCTAWLIPAIFILLINCELNRPWRIRGGQCRNLSTRWQFIAALDVITEIILFILAVALLKGLFMSVKRKLTIGFAFSFRFPLIIFTILHITNLHSALKKADVTLAAIQPTLWLQVEVHYALVACSVFCLRPFMAAVSTNYGTAGDSNLESTSESQSGGSKACKSASASGSGSASRSRSLSRVRRKRAGTSSGPRPGLPRSLSKEPLCEDVERGGFGFGFGNCDASRRDDGAAFRIPFRRSLFSPESGPSRPRPARGDRRKGETRGVRSSADAIELMPHLHRQRTRPDGDGPSDGVDPERMVIRKEVEYSIEYEYDEAKRRGQGCSKEGCSDAMEYVY